LWGRGGALVWAHFGEGEYRGTEEAIQEQLRGEDVTADLPPPLEPKRPTDAPGAGVARPSEEVFPGGSPAEPWEPRPGDDRIDVEYAAGGAYLVADGSGEIKAGLDGAEPSRLDRPEAGLVALAEHPRHERHRVDIVAGRGARVWAVSFAPGMP
jgi:hypothetical protein